MNKPTAFLIVPVAASALLATGCASTSTSTSTSTTTTTTSATPAPAASASTAASTAAASTPAAAVSTSAATSASSAATSTASTNAASAAPSLPSQCPAHPTATFSKSQFVTDVGLGGGTYHHYIYAPFQAGAFSRKSPYRVTAMMQAAAVASLDSKLFDNAYRNVQASPSMCKAVIVPMGQLRSTLSGLKSQMAAGNVGVLATIDGLVNQIETKSAQNGAPITEHYSIAAAQQAAAQG